MTLFEAAMLFLAGTAAGTINTVVGSGSLITFPALLAFGYSPLTANMTNNLGVLPGAITGAFAYRSELKTQWSRVRQLVSLSLVGGLVGALLLLRLPAAAFDQIVPVLVLLAIILVILQPWLKQRVAKREARPSRNAVIRDGGIFLTGVYGGYFGAAQGILLMSILGAVIDESIQKLNSIKMMLGLSANTAAAIVFIFRGGIDWTAAGFIAVGALIGGYLGASIGRRLPEPVYRAVIVIVGLIAFAKLVTS
ncbi:MAG: sulfite exporter TauE/SafE family protein [Candidatus Nanopelagicaceae bacterium]